MGTNQRIVEKFAIYFMILGLLFLVHGVILGFVGTVQYIDFTFLKKHLSFNKVRAIHEHSALAWITITITGCVYYFTFVVLKNKLKFPILMIVHFFIILSSSLAIIYNFIIGNFGGREYFSYPPIINIPILFSWMLFAINMIFLIPKISKPLPIYMWMWITGISFMIFHLVETNLWQIDIIRKNFITDITIQWKSYGSIAGSWNMLVYGTSLFVMSLIKNDNKILYSNKTFFFFFLGLINLMFGWAHHTYFIPMKLWIRLLAYVISMTEWIVFVNIIYSWHKSNKSVNIYKNKLSNLYVLSTEFWVFINITLALLISIPSINLFTHGTHITVAHSMGTTIGINTSIIFSALFLIVENRNSNKNIENNKLLIVNYWAFNICLALFFITLLLMGINKTYQYPYSQINLYYLFSIFGFFLLVFLSTNAIFLLKKLYHLPI